MNERAMMEALFHQQRFQILDLGVNHNKFSDDYLYAWERSVYPFGYDSDGSVMRSPQEIFKGYFEVSKEKVIEVITFLDDCWMDKQKEVPTFYELERIFQDKIDRSDLIRICRASHLSGGTFDEPFWKKLMSRCPAEAHYIRSEYCREDICFN